MMLQLGCTIVMIGSGLHWRRRGTLATDDGDRRGRCELPMEVGVGVAEVLQAHDGSAYERTQKGATNARDRGSKRNDHHAAVRSLCAVESTAR